MGNNSFEGPLPLTPPVDHSMYSQPVFAEHVTATADPVGPEKHGRRGRVVTAALLAGAMLVGGIAYVRSGGDSHSAAKANAAEVAGLTGGEVYDACPDGMFPNGAYESSLDISTPGDLTRRPENTLNNTDDLTDYTYGKNGVACESAIVLAVEKAGILDMLGDGASTTFNFDTFGTVDEQADIYASDHDAAAKDADKLAGIVHANSALNSADLQGDYYQVVGVIEGDKVTAKLQKVQKTFAKDTVFVTIVGGDNRVNNQIMVTDRETGAKFFLNAVGTIPEISPEQQQQVAQAQQEQAQANGGGQFGTSNGTGESNQPGNVPESGGNGGVTPGTVPSFGPGGGGGGGGSETTVTTTGNTTTTTIRTGTTTTTIQQPTTTTTTLPPKDPPQPPPTAPPGY